MALSYLLGDCHTHLDQYAAAEIPDILERAGEAGVGFAVCAGTTVESSRACVQMARNTSFAEQFRTLPAKDILVSKTTATKCGSRM